MAKIDSAILSRAVGALKAGNVRAAILARKSTGEELFDEEGEAKILKLILTQTPESLADCPPAYLPPLRVVAAIVELFGLGTKSINDLITVKGENDYRYSFEEIGDILLRHAHQVFDIEQMADAGVAKVEVIGSGLPEECAVCREDDGKVYPVNKPPKLPHANCTCPSGCKCLTGAIR